MALQKIQSDSNQIESRNLRQVSHDTHQRHDSPHNLTLARLLNSPMEETKGDCARNIIVPVVVILLVGAILQVLTCSALFSQRKRHSVQMKQLMNAHYSWVSIDPFRNDLIHPKSMTIPNRPQYLSTIFHSSIHIRISYPVSSPRLYISLVSKIEQCIQSLIRFETCTILILCPFFPRFPR